MDADSVKRLITILLAASTVRAPAGVLFDAATNVITVADFAEDAPCTLKALHETDRANGWGRVTHDARTGTYTVTATLLIGENDRGSTFLRIGTPSAPREILVLKGSLYVIPPFVAGMNSDLKWASALEKQGKAVTWNGLTLGDPDDASVRPALRIATGPPFSAERLCVGVLYPANKTGYRTKLHVHNATIEPMEADSQHRIDSWFYCELRVSDSRIRGFRKSFFFGFRGNWTRVEGSVFEDCHMGPINSSYRNDCIKGCVFRNCEIGFGEWGGPMDLELTDCVLEKNRMNWRVRRGSARLVDCTVTPCTEGDVVSDRFASRELPEVIVLHHIVVTVEGPDGRPVPSATVMVVPEQFDPTLVPRRMETDEAGKTPGRGAADAILLREYAMKAIPGRPTSERVEYTYEIIVQATGSPEKSIRGFRATSSWQEVTIALDD